MNPKATLAIIMLACALALSLIGADSQYFGIHLKELDAVIAKAADKKFFIFFEEFDGFKANLNVQIQQFQGTLKDYDDISQKQMDAIFKNKWNTLSKKQIGESELFYELIGSSNGIDMHFYCRVVKDGSKLYLITATSKQGHWETIGDRLRRHVNAFKAK